MRLQDGGRDAECTATLTARPLRPIVPLLVPVLEPRTSSLGLTKSLAFSPNPAPAPGNPFRAPVKSKLEGTGPDTLSFDPPNTFSRNVRSCTRVRHSTSSAARCPPPARRGSSYRHNRMLRHSAESGFWGQ